MQMNLIRDIELTNPWLIDPTQLIFDSAKYLPRIQTEKLLSDAWNQLWLILTGPRQAGKTTLGKYVSQQLLESNRFEKLLYLNCDLHTIREWLQTPAFIQEALQQFSLKNPIIFIDEVQRLENPGLLLKVIADLKLPIKMIASGSSQLEIKSKVQEYLTGRQFECIVLPFSCEETPTLSLENRVTWGTYPSVLRSQEKALILQQLFNEYISKDIIEILQIGLPDVMRKLITLIAHASGQLVNYQRLATDCGVSIKTAQNYLAILEQTYVIQKVMPFVGNKRSEITSNPIYYFIDCGFRNQALQNFSDLTSRTDQGLLIQNLIFQEMVKYRSQYFKDFAIHFWRTTSGAEVDFVLTKGLNQILPIEVKFQNFKMAKISRGFRSFIQAYHPENGIIVTKNFMGTTVVDHCKVHFIAIERLQDFIKVLQQLSF